ncbi:flavin monoamine oxidase family protein [Sciscionella marina]|uniref:flavin monoamine oxidase family protein n=1 Tax=Sciscionella marina TaxID=508770 RepID=UPI000379D0F6|nr:NAD(P)/FAD-dependent oxidoreductase [Sciscionella marina]
MTTFHPERSENGAISAPLTMFGPDFPFPYDDWLAHPGGLGRVPAEAHGTEVAVIGGGIAGMVAAHELLRLGLRPVVYEAEQDLGGRMCSPSFDGHPEAIAELGAMRFPTAATTLFHYIREAGLETKPFPNPLSPSAPSTVIDLEGREHWARTAAELPSIYQQVSDAWDKALQENAERSAIEDAIRRRDVRSMKAIWNGLVARLDDQSFYEFLANAPSFSAFRYREIFGQVGFGTGGWDTDFPNSILEILRVVFGRADDDHHTIVGGSRQLPEGLWRHRHHDLAYWPDGTSLAALHEGHPRPAVSHIDRCGTGITVRDIGGGSRVYPAAIFTPNVRLLLTKVRTDERLLPRQCWTAVERTHYMGASKVFVLTDRPFWQDKDPVTGRDMLSMTLTDRAPRSVYLLDDGPDRPGVICLSYTWNDDSLKQLPLTDEERMDSILPALERIYPGAPIREHVIGKPITVTWEREPNFNGAFKANLPGHYRYQRRLYTHFMQQDLNADQRGFFLAGDDVSWTGGFAEGAVTTALNAVWGVLRQFGGTTCAGNPGPGDLFADLAPVELPMD